MRKAAALSQFSGLQRSDRVSRRDLKHKLNFLNNAVRKNNISCHKA
jgi:hypothetical protein